MSGLAYAAAGTMLAPGLRVMLRRRAAQGKEIAARLAEREGVDAAPRPPGRLVWVHAASMGETQAVLPVLAEWQRAGVAVLMTTGTVTSAALVAERAPGVLHRFVPLDVPRWVGRFLEHWRPDVGVFVESELWPNLIAACRRRGMPLALLNGRMSGPSFRGWRRAPGLALEVTGAFARVYPRTDEDGARLRALGAPRVEAPGNLKLAADVLPVDAAELARLRALLAGRPVWLAASTHPGEEEVAAAVHHALAAPFPGLVTIVAPRHAGRGAALAHGLGAGRRGEDPAGIWIADSMGELGLLYRLAPTVFVGRSLTPPGGARGGQNVLEPARLGCAVSVGPHTANQAEAVALLEQAGGLVRVADGAALSAWVGAMLADPARRAAMGEAGVRAATGDATLPARLARAVLGLI